MEKSKKKREKKKKLLMRRIKFFVAILVVCGVCIFLIKAPIFNIKYISVQGTKNVNKEDLLKKVEFLKGKNIFLTNKSELSNIIDSDDYINSIKIKKEGLTSIKLIVEEPVIEYYYQIENTRYILNEDFVVVDIINEDIKESLVKIEGIDLVHKNKGEELEINKTTKDILRELTPYFNEMEKIVNVNSININNITNLIINLGDINLYIGDITDLHDKLNMAMNIIEDESLGLKAGEINVSVMSTPVIKKEEVNEENQNNEDKVNGEENGEVNNN